VEICEISAGIAWISARRRGNWSCPGGQRDVRAAAYL